MPAVVEAAPRRGPAGLSSYKRRTEGKISMSDRLLGEASAAGGTGVGSNGAGGLAEGFSGNGSDASQEVTRDVLAERAAGAEGVLGGLDRPRRRRRGSRGGRGRRSAATVEAPDKGQDSGSPPAPVGATGTPPLASTTGAAAATPSPPAGASPAEGASTEDRAESSGTGTAGAGTGASGAASAATGAPGFVQHVASAPLTPGSASVRGPGPVQPPSAAVEGAGGAGPLAVGPGSPAGAPSGPAGGPGGNPGPGSSAGAGLAGALPGPSQAGEVRKPKIGDTRPGSPPLPRRRPRKDVDGGAPRGTGVSGQAGSPGLGEEMGELAPSARQARSRRRRGGVNDGAAGEQAVSGRPASVARGGSGPSGAGEPPSPRPETGRRRGERRLRPLGRYLMVVHVGPTATQIAVLEGRTLIEHYVSRPADDTTQIDGNIYLGRVQNVLPGMEAAFVDIGTPKNAVLYRGDLRYDEDDVAPAGEYDPKPTRGRLSGAAREARIEQLLHTGQNIICQVTKNPIGTKGARLTQEVSLPGRFVVLIPESDTYGISKRLPDEERRRLRRILDEVRPEGHGLIVRTAAEGASADELGRDVSRLLGLWEKVQSAARTSRAPQLLYREPDLAVRVIREEFNLDYRGVVIDDPKLHAEVKQYVTDISPELADRVELVDPAEEPLPLFERFRVHEQVHKALDRKVWLPSGGSIIIERTEALTVIDVNTGKNVGTSNLEETVFRNNLEAADEIARQLRLRDIGGIIVIDFIDMEVPANRAEVMRTFREALARDKTRTQVYDISDLGLVEMTRKRVSEGLVESYSETCPTCGGRGIVFDESLLG